MCQGVYLFLKRAFKMLVKFSTVFLVDTKIIFDCNFRATLSAHSFFQIL